MAAATVSTAAVGGFLSWSGTDAQSLVVLASTVGSYVITLRSHGTGVDFGGPELAIPQRGFELASGQEYTFHVKYVSGTGPENTMYVRNPDGGSNSLSYLIAPE